MQLSAQILEKLPQAFKGGARHSSRANVASQINLPEWGASFLYLCVWCERSIAAALKLTDAVKKAPAFGEEEQDKQPTTPISKTFPYLSLFEPS